MSTLAAHDALFQNMRLGDITDDILQNLFNIPQLRNFIRYVNGGRGITGNLPDFLAKFHEMAENQPNKRVRMPIISQETIARFRNSSNPLIISLYNTNTQKYTGKRFAILKNAFEEFDPQAQKTLWKVGVKFLPVTLVTHDRECDYYRPAVGSQTTGSSNLRLYYHNDGRIYFGGIDDMYVLWDGHSTSEDCTRGRSTSQHQPAPSPSTLSNAPSPSPSPSPQLPMNWVRQQQRQNQFESSSRSPRPFTGPGMGLMTHVQRQVDAQNAARREIQRRRTESRSKSPTPTPASPSHISILSSNPPSPTSSHISVYSTNTQDVAHFMDSLKRKRNE